MPTPRLLRVDTSLHGPATSVSRQVADEFETAWVTTGGGPVSRRDLGAAPLPYLTEEEHVAMFLPAEARNDAQVAAQANAAMLADELLAADVLLLGAPLYNLNVPATLKTWVDHLFTDMRLFPGYGITQPLAGRTAVVVTSRGGAYGPGTPRDGWEYEEAYLRRLLVDILGYELHDVTVELTMAESTPAMAELVDVARAARAAADARAQELGAHLAARRTDPVG